MTGLRRLIVNADDFGLSPGVNDGVIEAHERGIVTTTSLMVRQRAAVSAARYACSHATLGVGLHIDLGEWRFVAGEWEAAYERVDLDNANEVEREVRGQIERFCFLVGRPPTHLDSHQHVHRRNLACSVISKIATEMGSPLRDVSGDARYCGDFYGQSDVGEPVPGLITVGALIGIVQALPIGTTELCCHPASRVDFDATYASERITELETLCDRSVLVALEAATIELTSFACARDDG